VTASPTRGSNRPSDWALIVSAQVLDGIAGYAFLITAGRLLGPAGFAPVSVMWTAQFLIGSGLFLAYELELARSTAEGITRGESTSGRYRATGQIFVVQLVAVSVALLALVPVLTNRLFDGEPIVSVALAIGVLGFAITHLIRGPLAGLGLLRLFALWFVVDAVAQTLALVALSVTGVRSPGPFALAAGGASIVAVVVVSLAGRNSRAAVAKHGAKIDPRFAARGPIVRSLSSLIGATLLTGMVTNIGAVAITWLDRSRSTAPAIFIAGLILTRPPLLLFQTAQATLIPRFTSLATAGDIRGFTRKMTLLVAGVAMTALVACAGAAQIGPWLLRTLFGTGYRLSSFVLVLQTAATFSAILALALGLGLISLSRQDLVAACWAAGVLALGLTLTLPGELTLRVARAMVVAGGAASASMMLALLSELRSRRRSMPRRGGPTAVPAH